MTLAARIAHNSVVSSITRVLSIGLALVNVGLMTRYLGTGGYGDYSTVIAFYFLVTALSDFGINQILTREISRPKADEKKILANVLGLRAVSSLVVALGGALSVFFFNYSKEIKLGIWVMCVALVFSSLSQTLNSVYQKRLVINRMAWRELWGRLVQLVLTFLVIKNNWGVSGIVGATAASYVFIFGASWKLAKSYVPVAFSWDKKYWKYFLGESIPLGLAAIVNFLYFKADILLLSHFRESHDVGIYSAAYKVIESLIYFPFMFMGIVMPVFSYNIFHRPQKFLRIASQILKALWIVTIPLTVLLFFLASETIRVIAGPGFEESTKVMQVLAPALGAIFLAHFFNSILIAVNKQKLLLGILSFVAFVSIVLNIIFIPYFSYMAAAFISTVSEILVTLAVYLVSRRWGIGHGKGWRPLPVLSFLTSSLGMILVLYFLNNFSFSLLPGLVVKGMLGGLVYFFLIFLTGGISFSEIKEIFVTNKAVDEQINL